MRAILVIAACAALVPLTVQAATYEEYIQSVDQSIAAGDGTKTMDLMCGWAANAAEYARAHTDQMTAALTRWNAFQHQRYSQVFQPPAQVESYFHKNFPWEQWQFVGSEFGGLKGTDQGDEFNGGRLVISADHASARVDLNLDGTPEMTLKGNVPEFSPGLSVSHDDAGDGTREQWLVSPAGTNPRTAASIWVYRDGRAISVIVKPNEGGPCGSSWCSAG